MRALVAALRGLRFFLPVFLLLPAASSPKSLMAALTVSRSWSNALSFSRNVLKFTFCIPQTGNLTRSGFSGPKTSFAESHESEDFRLLFLRVAPDDRESHRTLVSNRDTSKYESGPQTVCRLLQSIVYQVACHHAGGISAWIHCWT